jgi:5-methyltetrahydrofolate--homocysteine methyltransferase
MLIIGERINTVKNDVMQAYQKRDSEYFRQEVIRQIEAGADIIDINAGMNIDQEPYSMAWAVQTIQDTIDIPLCIDSSNPKTILAGFEVCKNKQNVWLNSITLDKYRFGEILPLVREYNCKVIALCMEKNSIPETADGRVKVAEKLMDIIDSYHISMNNVYFDTLIEPIAIKTNSGLVSLDTIRKIKSRLPEMKTVICLSAISFGLPKRRLINRVYLPLLLHEGLDAVFLDPLDSKLMTNITVASTLLNRDEYCQNYIKAFRKRNLQE